MKRERIARIATYRRAGGWVGWYLKGSLGEKLEHSTITVQGFEKHVWRALKAAGDAAKAFNADYRPKLEPRRPRQAPLVSRAGEDCQIFGK